MSNTIQFKHYLDEYSDVLLLLKSVKYASDLFRIKPMIDRFSKVMEHAVKNKDIDIIRGIKYIDEVIAEFKSLMITFSN